MLDLGPGVTHRPAFTSGAEGALAAVVARADRFVRCKMTKRASPRGTFLQALAWNVAYLLAVTVLAAGWLGVTVGNAAYMAVITFTTVGLGDFAPSSGRRDQDHRHRLRCRKR